MARITLLYALWASYQLVSALQVTPNSPCAQVCMDSPGLDVSDPNSSTTTTSDIPCLDAEYSSPKGTKFRDCMSCLQTSTFSQGSESDIKWFLYNLRYAVSYCVFGHPNGTGLGSSPCTTDAACGRLKGPFEHGIPDPTGSTAYSYCSAAGGHASNFAHYEQCVPCISAAGTHEYLSNFFVALEAGCRQQPTPGVPLGLNDTIFSTNQVEIVDPTELLKDKEEKPKLKTTVIIGIVAGSVMVLLAISAISFVCWRKRRNRRVRLQRRSSMSFQCQTHLASPRFWPDHAPIQDLGATMSPATDEEPPTTTTAPQRRSSIYKPPVLSPEKDLLHRKEEEAESYQLDQPYGKPITKKAALASVPLYQISTTVPPPTPPPRAHCSPYTPSEPPTASIRSPLSADSARSTSALLPAIRPYVPAEHGVMSFSSASPASTTTYGVSSSPDLSRSGGWPLPDFPAPVPSALAPASANAATNNPYRSSSFYNNQDYHHRNRDQDTTNTSPTTTRDNYYYGHNNRDDNDGFVVVDSSSGKKHPPTLALKTSRSSLGLLGNLGRKSPKPGGGGSATGSPVESVEIRTAFAAPPRR